jgi:N utilization substance protein B
VRKLAGQWTFSVIEKTEECDKMFMAVIKRWSPSMLLPVEKAILRLSIYHLLFCPEIPGKVVINEAVELAKKFGTENSPGFVNGILDAVFKRNNDAGTDVSTENGAEAAKEIPDNI